MTTPLPAGLDQALAMLANDYTIGPELGRGGQGVVYDAIRTKAANRRGGAAGRVALKLHFTSQEDERIVREIQVMEQLSHPHLAHIAEHGIVSASGVDVRFIAWDFIDGETLRQRIANAGALTAPEVCRLGTDVAGAIAALWQHAVVHRDVKPENVMLRTGDGGAVVIDLGVARTSARPRSRTHRPERIR